MSGWDIGGDGTGRLVVFCEGFVRDLKYGRFLIFFVYMFDGRHRIGCQGFVSVKDFFLRRI